MKRVAVDDHPTSPPIKKAHPFFTGGTTTKDLGVFLPSQPTLIHYLHLDPFSIPQPPIPSSSTTTKIPITFYDLDGTLIKPRTGNRFPTTRSDWQWWHGSVLERMKSEWEEGRHLIVISNQGDKRESIRREWNAKLPLIVSKLPTGMPIRILAGLAKDAYRKPNIGMFDVVQAVYRSRGYEIDMEKSVFVGDAAGRMPYKGKAKDHGDTDFKFALNVGLQFVTPEEHFLRESRPQYPIPPVGFIPSRLGHLAALPHVVPSHTPIARNELEIVVFVGPPASGKTTFYRRHFSPRYTHINQDTLKSRDKCLRVAEDCLRAGTPVVIDNTNRNRETRSSWIALAARLHVPIRLFHFLTPIDLARHNNMYRVCYAPPENPPRTILPASAFVSYPAQFQEPNLDEGFDEIRGVNFRFEGTREQRKRWDMYMLEVK